MSDSILGYHFTSDTLRDGRPIPPIGEWLEHDGPIQPCWFGLHMSEHPYDALKYAPGSRLHRVVLEGDLVSHGTPTDKWVGRRRKILATIDADTLLRDFARWCALQVVYKWGVPDVVLQWLKTGDTSIMSKAFSAAEPASMGAEGWPAARSAMYSAAQPLMEPMAWSVPREAADWAAWSASWSEEPIMRSVQRDKLLSMVEAVL